MCAFRSEAFPVFPVPWNLGNLVPCARKLDDEKLRPILRKKFLHGENRELLKILPSRSDFLKITAGGGGSHGPMGFSMSISMFAGALFGRVESYCTPVYSFVRSSAAFPSNLLLNAGSTGVPLPVHTVPGRAGSPGTPNDRPHGTSRLRIGRFHCGRNHGRRSL